MREEYVKKLTEVLQQEGLDAMMICPSEEMRFLAGFSPMMCERFQGWFIKADGSMFYLCNLLYEEQLREEFHGQVPVYSWFDGDVMTEVVGRILEEQGLLHARIGVNSSAQAFNVLELMSKLPVTFVNGKPMLEEMRIRKTPEEMNALRRSAQIADAAFSEVIKVIRPGMTEADIMAVLAAEMEKRGGRDCEGIVASGPNSSYPHYNRYDRVIEEQDLMVLDFGCTYEGMWSDMSRMVFVGGITPEQKKIYEIVNQSQYLAQEAAKEGALCSEVDAAAREYLAQFGYAETLINRVGHGIGYMIHEAPDMKKSNPRPLERGMAFSVEPGIYLAGRFGMRVENIVMINEKGETEVLNQSSREIIIVG